MLSFLLIYKQGWLRPIVAKLFKILKTFKKREKEENILVQTLEHKCTRSAKVEDRDIKEVESVR